MKQQNLILILVIGAIMTSCNRKAYLEQLNRPISEESLSTNAVQEDLRFLYHAIEEIVPFAYLYSDSLELAKSFKAKQSKAPQSIMEFYGNVLELIGKYNASHFFVQFPREQFRQQIRAQGKGVFPFYCSLDGNELYIDDTFYPADSMQIGYRLERINGLDADSLFRSFYRYTGGAETTKHYDTQNMLSPLLWLNTIEAPFQLDLKNPDGASIKLEHNGYFYPQKPKQSRTTLNTTFKLKDRVQYQQINTTTGFLRIKAFWGYPKKEYEAFLEDTFRQLKENGTTRLLIDLRGNGGGNDRLGLALLHYLTTKPFRFYGGQHRKVSKAYNKYFKYAGSMPWLIRQIPYGPAIRLFFAKHPIEANVYSSPKVGKEIKMEKIKPNPLRFGGEIFFIIDNGTYSSAVSLANAIEDFDLGTIIGQPSGSIPNEHGEIMKLKLPNSGLNVYLPSAFYVRANGDLKNPNPVLPNHTIPRNQLRDMTAEDLVRYLDQLEPN